MPGLRTGSLSLTDFFNKGCKTGVPHAIGLPKERKETCSKGAEHVRVCVSARAHLSV